MAGWLVVRLAIPHTIFLVQVRAEVLFMSTSFRVLVHLKTAQNTLVCCFHPIFILFTVFSDKISMPIVEKTVFKWLGANSQTLVDTLKLVDSHFVTFFTVISSTRQPFVWYREHHAHSTSQEIIFSFQSCIQHTCSHYYKCLQVLL